MTTAIGYATKPDLGRILALQYIAYRSEAEIYVDFRLPPLLQTEAEKRLS